MSELGRTIWQKFKTAAHYKCTYVHYGEVHFAKSTLSKKYALEKYTLNYCMKMGELGHFGKSFETGELGGSY